MDPMLAMTVDPWILAFSLITVAATIGMGLLTARKSKTASDFFVAGRSVSVGWNASAISGEYLSAASFMGVAGMVMKNGYDALWYPVCYACGYLFLLLFIAGPLRRFGAYTIPDFAEGRYDSPIFRKIAVIFVLFIGFFYTMPQMKGAGTTLAYIFPGLDYRVGVILVGVVITLNVALGGMKGITLVQAIQYWIKMFAICVPIFVLMSVYGNYGHQLDLNGISIQQSNPSNKSLNTKALEKVADHNALNTNSLFARSNQAPGESAVGFHAPATSVVTFPAEFSNKLSYSSALALKPPTSSTGRRFYLYEVNMQPAAFVSWAASSSFSATSSLAGKVNPENTRVYVKVGENKIHVPDKITSTLLEQEQNHILQKRAHTAFFRKPLPEKAPSDTTWISPFGTLTTKAAKAAASAIQVSDEAIGKVPLKPEASPVGLGIFDLGEVEAKQALDIYGQLTGRILLPRENPQLEKIDEKFAGQFVQWRLLPPIRLATRINPEKPAVVAEFKSVLEGAFATNGLSMVPVGEQYFRVVKTAELSNYKAALVKEAQQNWLDEHQRPFSLLYTYSLIIALVCGTAGLPHILVRFYTNPDGVAAKRTTMWVMILIGVFYVFPPVFGALGRNILPELYSAVGAKGTDKVVLELPSLLNQKYPGWGSVLSGITCAGAFAAFMSTFSGLLVSMTGALAHDVYGRILRPKSSSEERLRAFKICAVIVGVVAILLGTQVEKLDINFMVGQAFAIAAASYFPLLFLSTWWRGMTMKGAACGMVCGGLLALMGISLTSFTDLKVLPLDHFWEANPLLRILCEQPAIWAVPLAIGLMIVISKLTSKEVPSDIRMKMLVLHAPEKLGLKQEYIQEHQEH
ncbi:MAG: actP [Pedosphaera sp.]|nr:actP [Pedosphaera sp.]